MSPDQETIAYCFMDIIAKCVFGFVLLFSHSEAAPSLGAAAPVAKIEASA